jgi:hypothetical protein
LHILTVCSHYREDCEKQVKKYPCAKYKSFHTLQEAEDFVKGNYKAKSSGFYYAVRVGRKPGVYQTWYVWSFDIIAHINSCKFSNTISIGKSAKNKSRVIMVKNTKNFLQFKKL